MAISKVVYGGSTLIDLTGTTVTADTLAKGSTALDKAGNLVLGTMETESSAGGEYNAYSQPNGDGTQTIYITDAEGGGSSQPPVINQIPLSTDASGNPYNGGAGFKNGVYLSSSGGENSDILIAATGFIPYRIGQKINLTDCGSYSSSSSGWSNAGHCKIALYDSSKTNLYSESFGSWYGYEGNEWLMDNRRIIQTIVINICPNADISATAYCRICGIIDENSIIEVI